MIITLDIVQLPLHWHLVFLLQKSLYLLRSHGIHIAHNQKEFLV